MSRPLRIEYPGAFYHVMNRGADRIAVFHNPDFFKIFLDILAEAYEKYELEVHSFCLMNNHYHLLVCTPQPNLSKIMKYVNGVFTQRCNILREGDGPLFRGRYKSLLIDTDSYLLQCSRYIHLNPIVAGLVENPVDYPWSSYRYYTESIKKPKWLFLDKILGHFITNNPMQSYQDFVLSGSDLDLKNKLERKSVSPILGSTEFMSEVKLKHISNSIRMDIPQLKIILKNISPKPEDIIQMVSDCFNITSSEIIQYKRGRRNDARIVAIYLMIKNTQLTYKEIAEQFEGVSISGISNIYKRVEDILKNHS